MVLLYQPGIKIYIEPLNSREGIVKESKCCEKSFPKKFVLHIQNDWPGRKVSLPIWFDGDWEKAAGSCTTAEEGQLFQTSIVIPKDLAGETTNNGPVQ